MIIIKSGEHTIYDPRNPRLQLIDPKLTLEDSAAGSLDFKIYKDNANYGNIRRLFPIVSVERDRKTIFRGRVIADKKDFYDGKSIEAEGKLAFFNDSCLEPFDFRGSPRELLRMIIENHNAQVMPWQQFRMGEVTVQDGNDYIVRSSKNTMNSWSALKEKCFKSSLGGRLRIRYEEDGDYVDWLEDYAAVSSQSIEFARNMISMSLETDATETYTAIRPVGAEVHGEKIDISSVNGGKTYLVNQEQAAEYGIIFAPEDESVWEDVTLPDNLLRKASEKLYGGMAAMSETYAVNAVDLNLTDPQIEALDICEYVPVVSRPHGINSRYLLTKAVIAIASPQSSVYYLGASRRVFSDMPKAGTGSQAAVPQNVSAFKNDMGYISEAETEALLADYTREDEVKSIAQGIAQDVAQEVVREAVAQIPAGGLSAYEIAVEHGYEGTEEEWLESLKGLKGEPGDNGADGDAGLAATIKVGKVVTGDPGTLAKVENVGTETVAVLDFTIPKGDKGEKGSPGESGGSSGVTIDILATLGEVEAVEEPGKVADAMAVKELAERLPFRLGVDADGNYGYYKDGADAVIPFKTGSGGGGSHEVLVFTVPYDAAERYFTYETLDGNTYLPKTEGYWQSVHKAALLPAAIQKDFSSFNMAVQTG